MLKLMRKIKRWFKGRDKAWLEPTPNGTAPSAEQVFSYIYSNNVWGDAESASGVGSNLKQTRVLREQLPGLLKDLDVRSMLDIPCGDFHWLNQTALPVESYLGADIVKAIVETNQSRHARSEGNRSIRFEHLNLLESNLPRVDLILCRDCLVHFSTADVWRALRQIQGSGSTYLLTTTYPGRANDGDIRTGEWRPLNLEGAPFLLPKPRLTLLEGCTERKGRFPDKSLALWAIADLDLQKGQ